MPSHGRLRELLEEVHRTNVEAHAAQAVLEVAPEDPHVVVLAEMPLAIHRCRDRRILVRRVSIPCDRMLRDEPSSRCQYAIHLADRLSILWHVLEHMVHEHSIERPVVEGD
jgi:hypothetical protein